LFIQQVDRLGHRRNRAVTRFRWSAAVRSAVIVSTAGAPHCQQGRPTVRQPTGVPGDEDEGVAGDGQVPGEGVAIPEVAR
jgi:hypothetical protein